MSEDVFTIEPDKSLAVNKRKGQSSATLEEILSAFAEPIHTTAFESHYRITAASIWKARRQGLSLEDIKDALETYCETEIPASLLADVELWSQQIDRLWLETDQGRLVLRSHNSQLFPAIRRQRTLRPFIKQKIDANTLELQADTEADLIRAFDDAQYPMLDRRAEQAVSTSGQAVSDATSTRQKEDSKKPPTREAKAPKRTAPRPPPRASRRTDDLADLFRSSHTNRCRAITRAGRQCKNRVRPPDVYCRIHMELASLEPDEDPTSWGQDMLFKQLLDIGLITMEQLALFRVGISVAIGLSTWLLNTLLMWVGAGWLGLPLASWYTIPLAFLLTSWIVSKFLPASNMSAALLLLLFSLGSILMDFFNKEGLILNICFVLIPFVLPLYLLYRYSLSGWWGLLMIPVGLFVGRVFYYILEESSE